MNGGDRLVAVDWGTSSFRAALLDAQGRVLQETCKRTREIDFFRTRGTELSPATPSVRNDASDL